MTLHSSKAPTPGTQLLRRAHAILRLLASHNRDGLRVIDIASQLGLEQPTAHRILQGLVQERMVIRDPLLPRYFLGPALVDLGLTAAAKFPWRELTQASVARLAKQTGDTVVVTLRAGADGICIEHKSGEFPIQASIVSVGTRRPLAAGAGGLAILSQLDSSERQRLVNLNATQLGRDVDEILQRVEAARKLGYSVNNYRRTAPAITAIGVPVTGNSGNCNLGIAVVALAMRLSGKRRNEILASLHEEAAVIGEAIAVAGLPGL